ncbi:MAG: hypothetical protein ACTSRG_06530 [Candidatus Helarchaeota archaeon]
MSVGTSAKLIRQFSRNIENFFFVLLYREIVKKTFEEFKDPLQKLRLFGKNSAEKSCEKHRTILKLIKPNPKDVVETINTVWYIVFGQKIDFEHEIIENAETNIVQSVIIKTKICPLCSGLDKEKYFTMIPLEKLRSKNDGYACVLCAIMEGATNYILSIHNQPYRIKMNEIKCLLYGKDYFVLKIDLYKNDKG